MTDPTTTEGPGGGARHLLAAHGRLIALIAVVALLAAALAVHVGLGGGGQKAAVTGPAAPLALVDPATTTPVLPGSTTLVTRNPFSTPGTAAAATPTTTPAAPGAAAAAAATAAAAAAAAAFPGRSTVPAGTPTTTTAATTPPTTVPTGPGSAASFAFLPFPTANADGTPIRWARGTPIHYVVNPANEPAGADADLAQAFAALQAATGLTFVKDGVTTFSTDTSSCTAATQATCWMTQGPAGASAVNGHYPPVLVGWSRAGAAVLAGSGGGYAVVIPQQRETSNPVGDFELVSAVIAFNGTPTLPGGFGGSSRGGVMLHALGSLVGLATVTDIDQMMYPSLTAHLAVFGAGDRAGLTIAGQGYPSTPVYTRP